MNSKLKDILSLAKCGVYLTVNSHKDDYETVEEYMSNLLNSFHVDEDIIQEMVKRDTIIELQVYPHTPVGFIILYHYDLDTILDKMLEILKEDG